MATRLIDYTYFERGNIKIPQFDDSGAVQSELEFYIDKYEKVYLISLLGYDLYKAFMDDFSGGTPQTQKYLDLLNGKDYTIDYNGNSQTVHWNGLKNSDKESLLAYFVYYWYMRSTTQPNTGTGVIMNANENSEVMSAGRKMALAWNSALELYGKITPCYSAYFNNQYKDGSHIFYYDNLVTLPTLIDRSEYATNALDPSAFNFITQMNLDNGDDYYENWIFTEIKTINEFGI